MTTTREKLVEAVRNSTTVAELNLACEALRNSPHAIPIGADPEMVKYVVPYLASIVHAVKTYPFPLTISRKLVLDLQHAMSGEPGAYLLFGANVFHRLATSTDFGGYVSVVDAPVEHMLAGHLGSLYGMHIFTDSYYMPSLRQLEPDSLTIMNAKGSHGLTVILR